MPLPQALKALVHAPKYAARASVHEAEVRLAADYGGRPRPAPRAVILDELFTHVTKEAALHGIAWGEWATMLVRAAAYQTATFFALNAPGTVQALHAHMMRENASHALRPLPERVDRACLMREVGLKTVGLIGIPKVRRVTDLGHQQLGRPACDGRCGRGVCGGDADHATKVRVGSDQKLDARAVGPRPRSGLQPV